MALELVQAHDGMAGRVMAFSGRYAELPRTAPRYTTLHLLHGSADPVMDVALIQAAQTRLDERMAIPPSTWPPAWGTSCIRR